MEKRYSEQFEWGGYNLKNLILSCDITEQEKDYWVDRLDHKEALSETAFSKLPEEIKCFIPYIYQTTSSLGNTKYLVPANFVKMWQQGLPLPDIKRIVESEPIDELLNATDYTNVKKEITIEGRILSGLSRWHYFTGKRISVDEFIEMCVYEFTNKDDVRRYIFSDKVFASTDYHKIKIGSREKL